MVVPAPSTLHLDLLAPLSGLMVPLAEVPDAVFARKLVGDGVSIDPTSSELRAPVAGTVTQLHSAHHAIAITSKEGVEVLLHLGLDTVMLKGEGFTPRVSLGDRVEAGQILIANVAAILAQVRGDAVGARFDGEMRGADRIRRNAAPRVAHSRNVIDVHAQAQRSKTQRGKVHRQSLSGR